MSAIYLFCAGYGYTARAIAATVLANGGTVTGTTRDPGKTNDIADDGVTPFVWDHDDLESALDACSHILVSAPPAQGGCPVFDRLRPVLNSLPQRWIGYLSSNGVYGDHQGNWVDEGTPPQPETPRAQRRLAAECTWQDFGKETEHDVWVFRLPGIYGPGRSAIDSVRNGTAKRIVKPGQVFSRIHVADIAGAVSASMGANTDRRLFNLCDDEPSPPQDVVTYACTLLGVTPPPEQTLEDAI